MTCFIARGYKAKGQIVGEMGTDSKFVGGRVAADGYVCLKCGGGNGLTEILWT